jgi:tetrahydromethanopterin S-methyltransferase subunit D
MLSLPIHQYPTIILSICMILKSIWDTARCHAVPVLGSPAPLAFWTNAVLPTSMLLPEAAGFLSATPVSKALWSMMEESPLMFPTL